MIRRADGLVSAIICVLIVPACGGSAAATKTASAPHVVAPPAPVVAPTPLPAHAIRRSAVRRVLKGGLGLFLQTIALDDMPALKDGKFQGFRIAELRDQGLFGGVDLQPGDVITKVNGMAIEHPDEALEAFRSLEVASELRVDYLRGGEARELRYSIVDDEPPVLDKRADASTP